MNTSDGHQLNAGAESESLDRFVKGMRRRETAYLALLSLFLVNALAAAVLGAWVILSGDPAAGFLGPAIIVEGVSLALLALLWSRTRRRRALFGDRALPTREFLARAASATRQAMRERRLVIAITVGVLTPLFALATWTLVRSGDMSARDAFGMGVLYGACLLVVAGESWARLKGRLAPALERIESLRGDVEGP